MGPTYKEDTESALRNISIVSSIGSLHRVPSSTCGNRTICDGSKELYEYAEHLSQRAADMLSMVYGCGCYFRKTSILFASPSVRYRVCRVSHVGFDNVAKSLSRMLEISLLREWQSN